MKKIYTRTLERENQESDRGKKRKKEGRNTFKTYERQEERKRQ
jgi:hypothetical protein